MDNPYDIANGDTCSRNNHHCNCSAQIEQLKQCLCCINKQLAAMIANGKVDLAEATTMLTDIQGSITVLSSSISTISEQVQSINVQQIEYYNNTIEAISNLSGQSIEQYNSILEAIKKCCKCKDDENGGEESNDNGISKDK